MQVQNLSEVIETTDSRPWKSIWSTCPLLWFPSELCNPDSATSTAATTSRWLTSFQVRMQLTDGRYPLVLAGLQTKKNTRGISTRWTWILNYVQGGVECPGVASRWLICNYLFISCFVVIVCQQCWTRQQYIGLGCASPGRAEPGRAGRDRTER